jgi:hypothetical protein
MDRETTIGDFVSLLKQEIAERQKLVDELESRVGKEPRATSRSGLGAEAIEILRAAGRPMHGLHELLPELERRGYTMRSRGNLAGALLSTKRITRTAPGTFALKPNGSADGPEDV